MFPEQTGSPSRSIKTSISLCLEMEAGGRSTPDKRNVASSSDAGVVAY